MALFCLFAEKLKRAAARDRRKRIERRRLDRIKTRLDAARRRNAASARARAERRRSKRTQRAATAKKLDKWLADRRDSESISTKSKSLTKLRFIHRKLNATASAAANSKRATASAPDRIWSLNGPSEFKEYVFDNPRPYGLVIALTALGAAQKCEYCVAVHKLFEPLSQVSQSLHTIYSNQQPTCAKPLSFITHFVLCCMRCGVVRS